MSKYMDSVLSALAKGTATAKGQTTAHAEIERLRTEESDLRKRLHDALSEGIQLEAEIRELSTEVSDLRSAIDEALTELQNEEMDTDYIFEQLHGAVSGSQS